MELMKIEKWHVAAFILIYAIFVIINKVNVPPPVGFDEAARALGAIFIKESMHEWLSDPFLSISGAKNLYINFIDFGVHYPRVNTGLFVWPPLQVILVSLIYLLFGVSGFTTISLTVVESMILLFFAYKFVQLSYGDKNISYIAMFFLAFYPLIFDQSGSLMLEIGLAMFTVITFYYFSLYLKENSVKYLYYTALVFGLGFMYKYQFILILPAILLTFLWERRSIVVKKSAFTKENAKKVILVVCIIILVLSPWIIGQSYLYSRNSELNPALKERTMLLLPDEKKDLHGFWTMNDYYTYSNDLPAEKRILIMNKYNLSILQNLVAVFSSAFFQLFLLPFFIIGILFKFKIRKMGIEEKLALIFVVTVLSFFIMHGLCPRYVIPTIPFISMFASKGLINSLEKVEPKLKYPQLKYCVIALLFVLCIAQTSQFMTIVDCNVPPFEYDKTAIYIIDYTDESSTIITSSKLPTQQFSFAVLDRERKIYIIEHPEEKVTLEKMLNGTYYDPNREKDNIHPPPIKYIVIYEGTNTDWGRKFDISDFVEHRPDFVLVKEIEGKVPHRRVLIYERNNRYIQPLSGKILINSEVTV